MVTLAQTLILILMILMMILMRWCGLCGRVTGHAITIATSNLKDAVAWQLGTYYHRCQLYFWSHPAKAGIELDTRVWDCTGTGVVPSMARGGQGCGQGW